MTRFWIGWSIAATLMLIVNRVSCDHRPLTVHHPTLETVADMTPGNLMKYTELKLGTHVPADSVYWTATEGHFRLTDRPGEIMYVPPPRTLWHPDSCRVRLEVVK